MFKKYLQFVNEDLDNRSISIAILGDIVCENKSLKSIKESDPFEYVRGFLMDCDFVCGNLETTFSGSTSDRFIEPRFSSDDSFPRLLNFVDLLFTSNNHSLDFGIDGLLRTLDILDSNKIFHIGTFRNQDQPRYISINIKGKKFSFISFTQFINKRENTYNRISKREDLNPEWNKYIMFFDNDELKRTIKEAKDNSDFVIVYSHSDTIEYSQRPTKQYQQYIQNIKNMGADIVIGSHPHDFQGAIKDSIYSLGNFFSVGKIPNEYPINYGCILTIEIKNSQFEFKYIPTTTIKNGDFFKVIPFSMIEKQKLDWIDNREELLDKLKEIRKTFKEFNLKEYKIKED